MIPETQDPHVIQRKAFAAEHQRLMREITKSERAICRLQNTLAEVEARLELDGELDELSACIYAWNKKQLARLEDGLMAEHKALAALRASRPRKAPRGGGPGPDEHLAAARARRYRERNRERLAKEARERRARERLQLQVLRGELDIFR